MTGFSLSMLAGSADCGKSASENERSERDRVAETARQVDDDKISVTQSLATRIASYQLLYIFAFYLLIVIFQAMNIELDQQEQ